jgi:putative SOS response-associated peptidase YedK
MCGRYARRSDKQRIADHFHVHGPSLPDFEPSWNVAPPAFREAIKYRRCLVPADAFYEWQKLDAKTKQPFAIALKSNEPYAFAGLWERWKDRQAGQDLLTFTIITTDPNEVVQPLHDRMPVIIPAKDYDRWLRPGDPAQPPVDLLRPFDADKMTAWQVDRAVGNVKNDRAELIDPIQEAEPPPSLFGT